MKLRDSLRVCSPQIVGRITAMSEPASMTSPSVGLNLNYQIEEGGRRKKEENEGRERRKEKDQGALAQMAWRLCSMGPDGTETFLKVMILVLEVHKADIFTTPVHNKQLMADRWLFSSIFAAYTR